MKATLIILLCVIALVVPAFSATIRWDPIKKLTGNDNEKRMPIVHYCPSTGVTHVFWEELNSQNDLYLMHRVRFPNSELTEVQEMDPHHPLAFYENMISVQATPDCKHMLVAYGAYRVQSNKGCTVWNANSCIEVFFTESFNSGHTWTTPVRLNRTEMSDTRHRSLPSMVLEPDTGKVYIAQYLDMYAAMVYRDPGQKTFEPEKQLSLYMFGRFLHMGLTVDAQTTTKYLQMVWWENDLDHTKSIYYARSSDGGETWTKRHTLVDKYKSDNTPLLAVDTNAVPGGIYVQYSDGKQIIIKWSKNHGTTWEQDLIAGKAVSAYNALTICGFNSAKKGKVLTMGPGFAMVSGFLKYLDAGSQSLQELVYPFTTVKEMEYPDMNCGYRTENEVGISIATVEGKEILLATGKITDNTAVTEAESY